MAIKKWNIPKENKELTKILAQECGVSELVASILVNRGHSSYLSATRFLGNEGEIASPYDMKDMQEAVDRIRQAVDDFEKIAVYGDYDCDGVTSTAILYTYLSSIGADVMYYIPERDGEGYGMNKEALKKLADEEVSLIITVDNGISAINEANYAKQLGIDLVITDHHQPSETLPKAVAVVNPHRKDCKSPFKELCGAGVCFKLIAALEDGDCQSVLESFGDLVAVGTIGDIVPLVEENRALVKYGLQMLKMSDNIGLHALMEVAGLKVETLTATNVAFSLVPRINAAGRMGSARLAVQLLLSESEQEAHELAVKLDECNKMRQAEEQTILNDVEQILTHHKELLDKRVLILHKEDWNHGIIGIVCSKLISKYGKPVMLMTSEGSKLKGSARSIGEFHLFKALTANSELLLQYGGHKLAAGFSLHKDDFDAFSQAMEEYARKYFDLMPQYTYQVDKVLSANEITVENIQSLSALEPFGSTNEQPIFMLKQTTIESITPLSGDKHQKLMLNVDGTKMQALLFGVPSSHFLYQVGEMVDVVVNADINEYNNNLSVSLKIKDIRVSGFEQDKFFAAKGYYEKIIKNETVKANILQSATPTREDIATIYKLLRSNNGYNNDLESLYIKTLNYNINYCKMRVIISILDEVGLIELSSPSNHIKMSEVGKKVDLNQSKLLQRLSK